MFVTRGSGAAARILRCGLAFSRKSAVAIDNIFVFVIIFSELRIPPEYQRRVLRFGIAGALVFRALLIGAGITLIDRFGWVTYPVRGAHPVRGVADALRRGT